MYTATPHYSAADNPGGGGAIFVCSTQNHTFSYMQSYASQAFSLSSFQQPLW